MKLNDQIQNHKLFGDKIFDDLSEDNLSTINNLSLSTINKYQLSYDSDDNYQNLLHINEIKHDDEDLENYKKKFVEKYRREMLMYEFNQKNMIKLLNDITKNIKMKESLIKNYQDDQNKEINKNNYE